MSILLPPEPTPGQPIRSNDFRMLIRAVRSIIPRSSPTVRVNIGTNGTTYNADTATPRTSSFPVGSSTTFPFQIYPTPYTGSGSPPSDQWRFYSVRRGYVNTSVPSNINISFEIELGAVDKPKTTALYLKQTLAWVAGSTPVALTIEQKSWDSDSSDKSIPQDDSAGLPLIVYHPIGEIVATNSAVQRIEQMTNTCLSLAFVGNIFDCLGDNVFRAQWTKT